MPKSAMRRRSSPRGGSSGSSRSNVGRLLLAMAAKFRAQTGTDCFDIHPDQRLKRCANLFDSEAQVTDPVHSLERLRHKSQISGWARPRTPGPGLSADLSDWLGWDVGGSLGREGAFEARWQATRASLRPPRESVAPGHGRAMFSTPPRAWTTPTRYSNRAWSPRWTARTPGANSPADKAQLLQASWTPWYPDRSVLRPRFPRQGGLLSGPVVGAKTSPFPSRSPRRRPAPPRRLPQGPVLLVDVDGTLPNLALMETEPLLQGPRPQGGAGARRERTPPRRDRAGQLCVQHGALGHAVEILRRCYGATVQVGGSGVDLRLRLAPDIEAHGPGLLSLPRDGGSRPRLSDARLSAALPVLRGAVKEGAPAPGERL